MIYFKKSYVQVTEVTEVTKFTTKVNIQKPTFAKITKVTKYTTKK